LFSFYWLNQKIRQRIDFVYHQTYLDPQNDFSIWESGNKTIVWQNEILQTWLNKEVDSFSENSPVLAVQLVKDMFGTIKSPQEIIELRKKQMQYMVTGEIAGNSSLWLETRYVPPEVIYEKLAMAGDGQWQKLFEQDKNAVEKKQFIMQCISKLQTKVNDELRVLKRFNGNIQWLIGLLSWVLLVHLSFRYFKISMAHRDLCTGKDCQKILSRLTPDIVPEKIDTGLESSEAVPEKTNSRLESSEAVPEKIDVNLFFDEPEKTPEKTNPSLFFNAPKKIESNVVFDEPKKIESNVVFDEPKKIESNATRKKIIAPLPEEIDSNLFQTLQESVENKIYYPYQFFLGIIPSLGFLGTVVGMGQALLKSDMLFTAQSNQQRQIAVNTITQELGYAFDTTFIALSAGIIVGIAFLSCHRHETQFLMTLKKSFLSKNGFSTESPK
jgi:hypothetical protein